MNNADTPTATILSIQPGQKVRILGDTDPEQTYTVTEVNPVGKTGKQFRCALLCDKTGVSLTGIAPSRLAAPYEAKGPKTYTIQGLTFRPEAMEYTPECPKVGFHPAMYLAGMIKAPQAAELLDLVREAGEKGTQRAHTAVVMFCVDLLFSSWRTLQAPASFADKLLFGFNLPQPNYAPFLLLAIANIHATAFRHGSK